MNKADLVRVLKQFVPQEDENPEDFRDRVIESGANISFKPVTFDGVNFRVECYCIFGIMDGEIILIPYADLLDHYMERYLGPGTVKIGIMVSWINSNHPRNVGYGPSSLPRNVHDQILKIFGDQLKLFGLE